MGYDQISSVCCALISGQSSAMIQQSVNKMFESPDLFSGVTTAPARVVLYGAAKYHPFTFATNSAFKDQIYMKSAVMFPVSSHIARKSKLILHEFRNF